MDPAQEPTITGSTLPPASMASTMPFRFTSLPPELRNQVYVFLIESNPILNFCYRTRNISSSKCSPLPLLPLCAVNQQLRTEFHPLWLNETQHIVPLDILDGYLRTFKSITAHVEPSNQSNPTEENTPTTRSPRRHLTVTLSNNNFFTRSIGIYTNILPLIHFQTSPHTPHPIIKFAAGIPLSHIKHQKRNNPAGTPGGYATIPRAGAESARLSRIIANRNELWLRLIEHGISKVEIDSWGMVVRIYLDRKIVDGVLGVEWTRELAMQREEFEGRLGLEGMRCVYLVV